MGTAFYSWLFLGVQLSHRGGTLGGCTSITAHFVLSYPVIFRMTVLTTCAEDGEECRDLDKAFSEFFERSTLS
jgi:hypothetical protein